MKDLGSIKGAGLPQAAEARLEQWRLRIRGLHESVQATEARLNVVAQRAAAPAVADEPDLTPPPSPGGVEVTAWLSFVFIETDAPQFEQGHGYLRTLVYGAKYQGGALPTFANAVKVHEFAGNVSSFPSDLGAQWHLWLTWVSSDGVESSVPAGGTNGNQVTTGKIGTADLNDLIVTAGKLADGSITAGKVAAQSIDATKFANGIEPVALVSALPAARVTATVFNTSDGKLYRWSGSAYVATVPAADLVGQVGAGQIADAAVTTAKFAAGLRPVEIVSALPTTGNFEGRLAYLTTDDKLYRHTGSAWVASVAAADVTGQIAGTQITDGAISTPKLAAGAVTANELAAGSVIAGKVAAGAISTTELAAGAVTTAKLAVGAVTADTVAANAITGSKIAANTISGTNMVAGSIGTNELAANSITAGKIQTGAVTTAQVAAGAITTDKLLVTGRGRALNDDPACSDLSAWSIPQASAAVITGAGAPAGTTVLRATNGTQIISRSFPVEAGKTYKVSMWARQVSGGGVLYVRLYCYNAANSLITYVVNGITPTSGPLEGLTVPGSWTRYSGFIVPGGGSVYAQVLLHVNWSTTGVTDVTDLRCEEYVGSDLIVDGSIVASKLAANAIAVGSAAIQSGAIVNAMLGDASITTAKIADLSVVNAKLGDASVTAAKIADANITTAKIADANITSAKIANASITNAKVADLDAAKINAGTLDAARIAVNSLNANRITAGTITTDRIVVGAVTAASDAAFSSSATSFGSPGASLTAGVTGGVALACTGAPVFVNGTLTIGVTAANTAFARCLFQNVFLQRDSTDIHSVTSRVESAYSSSSGPIAQLRCNLHFRDSGATAGTHTYRLTFEFQLLNASGANITPNGGSWFFRAYLSVQENKV